MLQYSYGYNPFIIVERMLSENFGIQQQGNIVCIGSVAVSMLFILDIFIVLAHWTQQFEGAHVAPLGHIILILSKPVFTLTL
jgi:hypothetical protein